MADYNCELGRNRKCHTCGEEFYIPRYQLESWYWKHKSKYFCSYTCFRVYEKDNNTLKRRRVSKTR